MSACHIGCGCGRHKRNTMFDRVRQQQLANQLASDDQLTPKQLRIRQRQRRYRSTQGASQRGGGNHLTMPSETFDWDRAIAGFRKIMTDYGYDDDD